MQSPHSAEKEASEKEEELVRREDAVSKKEAIYAEREKDFAPIIRLIMTLVAQVGGFILLFMLGTGILPASGKGNITYGFEFIRNVAWYYVLLSMGIFFVGLLFAAQARQFKHGHVDFILLSYVGVDIFLLLMLVYQQGGICRSMFLPVFFLIPTAYLIAERRERWYRRRRVLILLLIIGCICSSYIVAKNFPPEEIAGIKKPVEGTVQFFYFWSFPITDFESLSHETFDKGLFYVSLISAFVPLFQISVTIIQERFGRQREAPIAEIDDPPFDTA